MWMNDLFKMNFLMIKKKDELLNEHWEQNCCEKLNKRKKMKC
jgi:hypothetical protein